MPYKCIYIYHLIFEILFRAKYFIHPLQFFGYVDMLSRLISSQPQEEDYVIACVWLEEELNKDLRDSVSRFHTYSPAYATLTRGKKGCWRWHAALSTGPATTRTSKATWRTAIPVRERQRHLPGRFCTVGHRQVIHGTGSTLFKKT